MAELKAQPPLGEDIAVTIGGVSLSPADLGQKTLIMPFKGRQGDLSQLLERELGLPLPVANQSTAKQDIRLMWFGRESFMLAGAPPPADLEKTAAVTDQTDAWASVSLSGNGIENVLARLVPIDLRPQSFGTNASVRTLLGHMSVSLIRTAEDRIIITVFRSMAETLVDEIKEAMEAVAARG